MFQTELIIWLQTFDSAFAVFLFNLISDLGYAPIYIALVLGISFGKKIEYGLGLLVIVMICQFLTEPLKQSFAYPRPADIDSRILEPGDERPVPTVDSGGAESFFSLLPAETVEAVRADPETESYGIPSGHTSTAAAFFFGLALLARSRSAAAFACIWVILMALSRMYLGRHFLGDVLAGLSVGVVSVAIGNLLIRPIKPGKDMTISARSVLPIASFAVLVLLLGLFLPFILPAYLGMLWGAVAAYFLIAKTGMPIENDRLWRKASRIGLAIFLYILTIIVVSGLIEGTSIEDSSIDEFLSNFLALGASLVGTLMASRYFKLYEFRVIPRAATSAGS